MRSKTNLQAECGVILFENDVPDIQGAVHLGDEEHGRTDGTPATVCEVRLVLSGERITRYKGELIFMHKPDFLTFTIYFTLYIILFASKLSILTSNDHCKHIFVIGFVL